MEDHPSLHFGSWVCGSDENSWLVFDGLPGPYDGVRALCP